MSIWCVVSSENTPEAPAEQHWNSTDDNTIAFYVQTLRKPFLIQKNIPLDRIVRHVAQVPTAAPLVQGEPSTLRVKTSELFDILNMLRAVQYDVQQYNQSMMLEEESRRNERLYGIFRLVRTAREWGLNIDPTVAASTTISVPGLDALIVFLENKYRTNLQAAQDLIDDQGVVDFDSLHQLFRPGQVLLDTGMLTGLSSATILTRCRASFYRRAKTAMGKIVSTLEASLELMVNVGPSVFALTEARLTQQEFAGTRRIQTVGNNQQLVSGSDILLIPPDHALDSHAQRGQRYQALGQKATMVEYETESFYSPQPSRIGGRLVVDTVTALTNNCHACKAPADGIAGDAIFAAHQAYSKWKRANMSGSSTKNDSMATISGSPEDVLLQGDLLLLPGSIPTSLLTCTWPLVCGFSFQMRKWGLALVDSLQTIRYHESAFDALVLEESRKRLVKALVLSHSQRFKSADILPGKGEGIIFLLHGPPGCGKTLTAEAVSEVLHRPLYRVSMGELGTTPDMLETKLQEIFDLCTPWNAMVLIDEAEILLESRASSNDLVRNAMVCVMLRLLEYYPGILFLTSNTGLDQLDPAIASRLTCTLSYSALDAAGRAAVWKSSLVARLGNCPMPDSELQALATEYSTMNGRQIKNTVQLAMALCDFEKRPVAIESLRETLSITSPGEF